MVSTHHSLEIKRLVSFEHVVNGSAQLDCQIRERASFAVFLLDAIDEIADFRAATLEQRNGFAKRPLKMSVADLLAGAAVAFAGRGVAAFDQPAVRQKFADGGEAFDVVNFVKHCHCENPSDARDGLQSEEVLRIVKFGGSLKIQFELADLLVEVVQLIEIQLDGSPHAWVFKAFGHAGSIGFVGELLFKGRQIDLVVDDLQVSQRFGSLTHQVGSSTQQVAGGAEFFGVGEGGSEVSST